MNIKNNKIQDIETSKENVSIKLNLKLTKTFPKNKKIVILLNHKGNKEVEDYKEELSVIPYGYFYTDLIEEARKNVINFVKYYELDYENWLTAKVFENGEFSGYISYNGNYFS